MGLVTDEGDAEISTRRRSLLEYRARLPRRILQLDDALERYGLFGRRSGLRAAWLRRLESLISTAKALDQFLGLERRQRVPPDLALALRDAPPDREGS